ncbi:MAG TPA: VCBS repeat-containing protein [Kofleriaceae bacterium]|nr:VCBS repeat-containing protein [Kofleriaceae bacterium]
MRLVGALLACAGCLSQPAFPEAAGEPFPPDGPLAVHAAGTGDLNGDGAPDLLLASAPDADGRGLYLVFGGAPGWMNRYHGFLPTPELDAYAIHEGDVDGDGLADVAIVGPTDVDQATLAVYLGDRPGGTHFATGLVRRIDGVEVSLDDQRAYLFPAQVDGDGDADLIAGQHGWEAAIELDAFDENFIDVPVTTLPRVAPYGPSTSAAIALPSGESGLDDLLVARYDETALYRNGGTGFTDTGEITVLDPDYGMSRAGFFDVGGDGRVDVLGWGGGRLIGHVPDPAGPVHLVYPDYSDGTPVRFDVADLDDDGAAEVIVVLADTGVTHVLLFAGVGFDTTVDPPDVTGAERDPIDLADFEAAAAALADFDGDGTRDLVMVAADGTWRCLSVRAVGASECATAAP